MRQRRKLIFGILLAAICISLPFLPVAVIKAPSDEEINAALDRTTIDRFSVDNAGVRDTVELIVQRVHAANPSLGYVPVVVYDETWGIAPSGRRPGEPEITLALSDVPVRKLFEYSGALSNHDYAVRSGHIYFYPHYTSGVIPPLTPWERFAYKCKFWYWQMRGFFPR